MKTFIKLGYNLVRREDIVKAEVVKVGYPNVHYDVRVSCLHHNEIITIYSSASHEAADVVLSQLEQALNEDDYFPNYSAIEQEETSND